MMTCPAVMQGNVKESQYDVDFFKSFDLVMNGLDNLEARRHVNRLCLAAETPLIESGTAGYLGQVMSTNNAHPSWLRQQQVQGKQTACSKATHAYFPQGTVTMFCKAAVSMCILHLVLFLQNQTK